MALGLAFILASAGCAHEDASSAPCDGVDGCVTDRETLATAPVEADAPGSTASLAAPNDRAWEHFVAEFGPDWKVLRHAETHVAQRIWGAGVLAPGTTDHAEEAVRYARAFLAAHIDLVAPGAQPSDFELVSDHLAQGVRSVGFAQRAFGMPVVGGQLSLRFKHDRLLVIASEAAPDLAFGRHDPMGVPSLTVDVGRARQTATDWLSEVATGVVAGEVRGPVVLPRHQVAQGMHVDTDGDGIHDDRIVLVVEVSTQAPVGRWDVSLDAFSGEPVARRQTLMFGEGTIQYNAPQRFPRSMRLNYPAIFADAVVDGAPTTADASGRLFWDGTANATVLTDLVGPMVRVNNWAGALATTSLKLSDGGEAVWNAAQDELTDAQISAFVHANLAKAHARTIAPDMGFLDEQLAVTVNLNDYCNAYSDGSALFFFLGGANSGCENMARLADVIYHEFGHSFHNNAIIRGVGAFDEALSEGLGDYYAASITGDPAIGPGTALGNDWPLRHIDPEGVERAWPNDTSPDPHVTGEIIGGALWDLRKGLIAELGDEAGAALTDQLFLHVASRAADIPTSFVEVLTGDDDDGNLANGTPHYCTIAQAFAPHGLVGEGSMNPNVAVDLKDPEGLRFDLAFDAALLECLDDARVDITYHLRGHADLANVLALSRTPTGFSGTIPRPADGVVLEYQVAIEVGQSRTVTPQNPAAPDFELFVGEVVPLYCTDFERDPALDGWVHGLAGGTPGDGADDWQWGPPFGMSLDPAMAYSPDNAFGNDLGGNNFNGRYQRDKTNFATTPVIPTRGYQNVRLQYRRWLTVEDATYDQASITSNDVLVWQNVATESEQTHHIDYTWRFHDVDLSATVVDDAVQVTFELASDQGLQLGGWTIDDVCVVAYVAPFCGDGKVQAHEGCDEGDGNSDTTPNACRSDCALPTCGDATTDDGELCDDGEENSDSARDACRADCTPARCGDGVVDSDEPCDDGADNDDTLADACRTTCVRAYCGDGSVDTHETCDDGAFNDDEAANACRTDCQPARCGDGVVDTQEACDDGAQNAEGGGPGSCTPECVLVPGGSDPDAPGDGSVTLGGGCTCAVRGRTRSSGHGWAVILLGVCLVVRVRRRR